MKTPKARKLPSGSWFIQLRLGGESVSVTEATETACIRKAQAIKAAYLAGTPVPRRADPAPMTLGQGIDRYIERKRGVLSPSTLRVYQAIRKGRFSSVMDRPIAQVRDWQAVVSDEARTCGAKTLKNAWTLAASVIEAETGKRPKVQLPQIRRAEHAFLEPDQIGTFCAAVRGDPVEVPALLGLSSLRLSELLALTWSQVDLDAATVRVSGAVVLGPDGLTRKPTNKNASSARLVPIMPQLVDALRAAPAHKPADPVVTLSPKGIYSRVNTVCRHAGLPEIGVHGLRHSFASLAYHLGLPYKVTMEIGGWSDDATMQRIYTHIARSAVTEGAAALRGFYAPAPAPDAQNANENANDKKYDA